MAVRPARPLLVRWRTHRGGAGPGMAAPARLPTALGFFLAFCCYLVAAGVLTALPVRQVEAVVALLVIAGAFGWWSTVPGAWCVGALGWPFYSGFVTHTRGQLGIVGRVDAVVLVLLVVVAVGATLVRTVLPRRDRAIRVRVVLPPADVPVPRSPTRER